MERAKSEGLASFYIRLWNEMEILDRNEQMIFLAGVHPETPDENSTPRPPGNPCNCCLVKAQSLRSILAHSSLPVSLGSMGILS